MGSAAAPFAGPGEGLRLALLAGDRGDLAGDADLLGERERDLDTERLALLAERERLTGDLDLETDLHAADRSQTPLLLRPWCQPLKTKESNRVASHKTFLSTGGNDKNEGPSHH